jgi:hypothetical protein
MILRRPSIPATRKLLISRNEGTEAFGCQSCSTIRTILSNAWITQMELDGLSVPTQRIGGVTFRAAMVRWITCMAQILL